MKLNEIQELIKFVAKSGVEEVELETKEIKIRIRSNSKGKINGNGDYTFTPTVISSPLTAANPIVQPPIVIPTQTIVAENGGGEKAPVVEKKSEISSHIVVKSPMIGTFYRSSEPGKPVFVNVGDEIASGKVICITEAMKLFNEIEAEIKGRIVKVLVDDASPVEYDQPLFLVEPM